MMTNKDKTGGERQSRLRQARLQWLADNAYGLSAEGLIGALMRGECSLSWKERKEKRPYNNQVNHYCEKCSAWKIHVRGSKYYTCLTCNKKSPVKMARGLTPRAPDKN
jgi:hypothetical protein